MAVGEKVRAAIDETWGLTLRSGGELVDARFYKCCGGKTELFSTAWADEDYPYLTVHDDPWCDTHDKEILGQVLNDYDLETEDFHDWTVRYKRADLAALIAKRSGVDIGDLVALDRTPRAGRLRPHQETPHRRFQDHAHRRQGTDYPPLPLRKPPVQLLVRRGDDG